MASLAREVCSLRVFIVGLLLIVALAGCIDGEGERELTCAPEEPGLTSLTQIAADPGNHTGMDLSTEGYLLYGGDMQIPDVHGMNVLHSFRLNPERDQGSGGLDMVLMEQDTPEQLLWAAAQEENIGEDLYSLYLVRLWVTTHNETIDREGVDNVLNVVSVHRAQVYLDC